MIATVYPSSIGGALNVPASKSAMQRALAAALIRSGKTTLFNPGRSADDLAALRCIQTLGASVEQLSDRWVIRSKGIHPAGNTLDCGESGLSIRMFTPLAALSAVDMYITGSGSLKSRPMQFFNEVLPQLGVNVSLNNGSLPIALQGPMQPKCLSIDGALSSQFLTGLLMAYSAAGAEDVVIEVNDLKSRPYIDLTLGVLQKFGMPVPINDGYRYFSFPKNLRLTVPAEVEYRVEGDWSGASFWFVAAALAGAIELTGLDADSVQADRMIERVTENNQLDLSGKEPIFHLHQGMPERFTFDATDCPDLFPPLVALACHCEGESIIKGISRLKHKESDRATVLKEEFGKLGVTITLQDDFMHVLGGQGLAGGRVCAQGDHRIAMALGVAALGARGPVMIEEAESVGKSYPGFWADLKSLGASLTLTD